MGEEVINIGFCGPLTPAAAVGIDALHGPMITSKEINDEGEVMVAGKKYKDICSNDSQRRFGV
jgi:ABC-type branched-subunit amino acid transport system substrate-binding protein